MFSTRYSFQQWWSNHADRARTTTPASTFAPESFKLPCQLTTSPTHGKLLPHTRKRIEIYACVAPYTKLLGSQAPETMTPTNHGRGSNGWLSSPAIFLASQPVAQDQHGISTRLPIFFLFTTPFLSYRIVSCLTLVCTCFVANIRCQRPSPLL